MVARGRKLTAGGNDIWSNFTFTPSSRMFTSQQLALDPTGGWTAWVKGEIAIIKHIHGKLKPETIVGQLREDGPLNYLVPCKPGPASCDKLVREKLDHLRRQQLVCVADVPLRLEEVIGGNPGYKALKKKWMKKRKWLPPGHGGTFTWDAEENTVCMDGALYPEMFQLIDDVFCRDPRGDVDYIDNRVRRIPTGHVIRDDGSQQVFNNHTDHYCCEANIVFAGGGNAETAELKPKVAPYVVARWAERDAAIGLRRSGRTTTLVPDVR